MRSKVGCGELVLKLDDGLVIFKGGRSENEILTDKLNEEYYSFVQLTFKTSSLEGEKCDALL